MNPIKWFILLCIFLVFPSSISNDTITLNQAIKDGDVLVSSQKVFALGFFSPGNSSKRYVGVWYNQVPNKTIVWVANRDDPVNDTSGLLAIHGNGGLVIYGNDRSIPLWSANITLSSPNTSIAKLLDTGNLVLLENGDSQKVLWQGFDYPTNTMLSSMKLGLNRRSGLNRSLTTWKSQNDPRTGNCSFWVDPAGLPQLILYKDGAPRWRTDIGSWTGQRWAAVTTFVNNEDEVSVESSTTTNQSTLLRTVVDESGILQRFMWDDRLNEWTMYWSSPIERCDFYGQCGPNGNCDPYNDDPTLVTVGCSCLPGYEPKSPTDWYMRNGSGGCVKEIGVSMCRNGEGFVKVENVKLPDSSKAHVDMSLSLKACEQECLRDCSCTAYSSANESSKVVGCVTWYGDLMDTSTYADTGQDLYVRVDAIVLAQYAKKSNASLDKKGKLAISLSSGLALVVLVTLLYWLLRRQRKAKQKQKKYIFRVTVEDPTADLNDGSNMNSDLPFFDLRTIAAITNNFSGTNKLGNGGFGSVYKGILCNGTEIAVKRLSKHSGQGIEQFKNEVGLISKLQHRNLVRILGYCVEEEEKMIIYEYVPNRSLDFFIFDETKRALLDWTKRFDIICGIARGILYLHQDSRLRIIHRDLKASNILLDGSMIPKIADFGMARIFRGDQSEASTTRVVGTYGYMSPEYAMEGLFSVKSDVYSFGVLLLEIITGRRNAGYYHEKYPDLNLIGHVWELWREGIALEIVDSCLDKSCHLHGVLRCIQIALLCVQEFAMDRPTMSTVVFMLVNDTTLSSPRPPAFLVKRAYSNGHSSVNDVTCSMVEAR